ncbi:hypothetical protein [Carbonactinospora thermoautotrophica]|uniref:hypothetical protein n=1 Tax=Carbonactinospora thermoautotrophica TaxID=1469144 RepID=UPI003DA8E549
MRLGLAVNAAQFTLLVAVNALVGGLLGAERTVLPLLAQSAACSAPSAPCCRCWPNASSTCPTTPRP